MARTTEEIELKLIKGNLEQELKNAATAVRSTYKELVNLKRLRDIGIKVSDGDTVRKMANNVSSLERQISASKGRLKLAIQTGASEREIMGLKTSLSSLETNLILAKTEMNSFIKSGSKMEVWKNWTREITGGQGVMKKFGTTLTSIGMKGIIGVGSAIAFSLPKISEYNQGVSKLGTITGLNVNENQKFADSLKNIAIKNNVSSVDTMEAAYQGFSGSLFKSTKSAQTLMPTIAKLSKVGFSDLTSVTDLASSAQNGYKLSTKQTLKAMNEFLQVQNKGKTTIAELSGAFGKYATTGKQAGFSLEDLNASMIQITKQGINTNVAGTMINSLASGFIKPSKAMEGALDKTGISLKEFEKNGGTLPKYLQLMMSKNNLTADSFSKLFKNVNAMKAANILATGGAKDLSTALNDVNNSGGVVNKTFKTWNKTTGASFDKLKTSGEKFALTLGNELAPAINGVATFLANLSPEDTKFFADMAISVGLVSAGLVGLGGALKVFSTYIEFMKNWKTLSSKMAGVTSARNKAEIAQSTLKAKIDERTAKQQIKLQEKINLEKEKYNELKEGGAQKFINEEIAQNQKLLNTKKELIELESKRTITPQGTDEYNSLKQQISLRKRQINNQESRITRNANSDYQKSLQENIRQQKSYQDQALEIDRAAQREKQALDNEFEQITLNKKIKSRQQIANAVYDIESKNTKLMSEEEIAIMEEKQAKLNSLTKAAVENRVALEREGILKSTNLSSKTTTTTSKTPTISKTTSNPIESELANATNVPVEATGMGIGKRLGSALGMGMQGMFTSEIASQIGVITGLFDESTAQFISVGAGLGSAIYGGFQPEINAMASNFTTVIQGALGMSSLSTGALVAGIAGAGALAGVGFIAAWKENGVNQFNQTTNQIKQSASGIQASLSAAFNVSGYISPQLEQLKTTTANELELVANNFGANSQKISQQYSNAFETTGNSFQSWVATAGSSSGAVRDKMVQAISAASGQSVSKINDIIKKLNDTNNINSVPKIKLDNKEFTSRMGESLSKIKAIDGTTAVARIDASGNILTFAAQAQQALIDVQQQMAGVYTQASVARAQQKGQGSAARTKQVSAAANHHGFGMATGGVLPGNVVSTINERGLESIRRYGQVSLLTTGQGGGEILNASQTKSEIANNQQQQVIHLAPTFNISQSQSPQDVIRMIRGELRKINF